MSKTIKQWGEALPTGIRERFLSQSNQLERVVDSLHMALTYGLTWQCTNEGIYFWQKIYEDVTNSGIQPFSAYKHLIKNSAENMIDSCMLEAIVELDDPCFKNDVDVKAFMPNNVECTANKLSLVDTALPGKIMATCNSEEVSERIAACLNALSGIDDPLKWVKEQEKIQLQWQNQYVDAIEEMDKYKERVQKLETALESLIFTSSKLWEEVSPIKSTEIMTVTHPVIEQAKEALKT